MVFIRFIVCEPFFVSLFLLTLVNECVKCADFCANLRCDFYGIYVPIKRIDFAEFVHVFFRQFDTTFAIGFGQNNSGTTKNTQFFLFLSLRGKKKSKKKFNTKLFFYRSVLLRFPFCCNAQYVLIQLSPISVNFCFGRLNLRIFRACKGNIIMKMSRVSISDLFNYSE